MEASIINVGISIGGALIAIGGAWSFMRFGIKSNAEDIVELKAADIELKATNSQQWTKINETNVTVARIDANVETPLGRK